MTDSRFVGLLCDYFAAPTDDAAAATIDWVGGPSRPGGEPRRGRLRRHRSPEPYRVVDMSGVEPTVQMATLEAILTGRPASEALDETIGLVIAHRDGGERTVVCLTASLQEALAQATDEGLAAAVDQWAQTEEFWGQGDPAILLPEVRELADLARDASRGGQRLYCWVCV